MRIAAVVILLLVWLTPSAVGQAREFSAYERETLKLVLARRNATIDPNPRGKIIEAIDIDVLDVIEKRDPLPGLLNVFHVNSKRYVIERALLFAKGDRYHFQVVRESERALRGQRQLSLVIVAAVVGSRPDRVRILVICKDVWSLRLNADYRFRAGQLEYLLLQPAEENLAGTHRRINAQFVYRPDAMSIGGSALEPRIAGSRLMALLDANVIVNHRSGDVEGSFGGLQYGLPLFSTRQLWSWGAVAKWHREITRRYIGTQIRTYDAKATAQDDQIPFVYDTDTISGRYSFTRSFGYRYKRDISLGVEADRRVFRSRDLSGFAPAAADEFRDSVMPRSDTRNGPFVAFHLYHNLFARLHDIETLGLEESYVRGIDLHLRVYPVAKAFGSTRDFIGHHAEVSYTIAHGGFLTRAYVGGTAETKPNFSEVIQSSVHTGLRAVSPRFFIGRLIYDSTFFYRAHNYLNRRLTLGGDSRLRGYPSGLFLGENLIASNLEFRSRPIKLWTVQLGGALFYDVADAFDEFGELRLKQGAGFGLRMLMPMFGRAVMRVDWGFALTPEASTGNPFEGLVITFRQPFTMPSLTGKGIRILPP